jgi:hypothetical protein
MNNFDVNKPVVPALATGFHQIPDKNLTQNVRVQTQGKLLLSILEATVRMYYVFTRPLTRTV